MNKSSKIKKGSIQLIPFPFTDLSQKKVRPCVILAHEGDDVTVVFITSVKPKGNAWVTVQPSNENGIKLPSYIRYSKIATLDTHISLGEIGTLEHPQYKKLVSAVTRFLSE